MLEIKLLSNKSIDGYTIIEGFPGAGLVGTMAVSYMVEKLSMEYFGYFDSQAFPPLVSIHDGIPMHPVRLYVSHKYKLIAIFAEFAIPAEMSYMVASKIIEFVKANKISQIISIGGMPSQGKTEELEDGNPEAKSDPNSVYAIVSDPKFAADLKKNGITEIKEGVASGISALLIIAAAALKIDDINLLVPIDQNIVDPAYAEYAIKSVNKLLDLNIDITELDKEAKEVEAKIKALIKKNKESHEGYKKATEDAGPAMYA
ncbi:PAC2 family protein [Candidatus Marsarchaeota archaeon]|nr:PAC2 family protein [Candidatus Marsarchaeota archaeon]MCL5404923.1 PAC2 family protein [Candidatus Marsarchaeota archaeon]